MHRRLLIISMSVVMTGCGLWLIYNDESTGFPSYDIAELTEPSGLAASLKNPGVFWTHNDSGDEARIFAVTAGGALLGEFAVRGASAVDWEAITTDDSGRLYIADFGNNFNDRQDLVLYTVPEPEVDPLVQGAGGLIQVEETIPFHYPDQRGFPDDEQLDFDAEAIFWAKEKLYVLTKHRSDLSTTLYRLDQTEPTDSVPLVRISTFEVGGDVNRYGGRVTGADVTPDGRLLAVLCYHALFVFERPEVGDDYLSRLVNRVDFDQNVTRQTEAIAWDGDALVFTNEGGSIFRIENPLEATTALFPSTSD